MRAGAAEEGGPRQCERDGSGPQVLVHGHLDRGADVLVNQFAERDKLTRSDRLADTVCRGAFLRWPPARAAGWSCTSPTGRMRHFSFHPTRDTTKLFDPSCHFDIAFVGPLTVALGCRPATPRGFDSPDVARPMPFLFAGNPGDPKREGL